MKQIFKFFMLMAIAATTFTACEKDEPVTPDRDKFLGTWTGTGTVALTSSDGNESGLEEMEIRIVKSGDESEVEIYLDADATPVKAKVNGARFDINSGQNIFWSDDEFTEKYGIKGFGSIGSNNLLSVSIELKYSELPYWETLVFTGDLSKKP